MRNAIFILLCLFLLACTTTNSSTNNNKEDQIVHVVLIWLKEPGNERHINQIIAATNNLLGIPEIKQLDVGKSIPSKRKIVDDSFDVGLVMTFTNLKDMQHYLAHPKHKHLVKTSIKPLASKLLVYDFVKIPH